MQHGEKIAVVNYRCSATYLFVLLLASPLAGCGLLETRSAPRPPIPSAEELRAAAMEGLQQQILTQPVEAGEPYEVCTLPYSALDRYRNGTRLGALLECAGDVWRVPLLANGSVHSTIDVTYMNESWSGSRVALTRDLQTLVSFMSKNKELGAPVLFRIDRLYLQFALFNKGFDEQILVLTDGDFYFKTHKANQAYPAREIMPQIIKAMDEKSAR